MFDFLIVGCGLSGCVLAERIASESKKKVIIVDKRLHIGGNAYDHYNSEGILIHKYGPHWFHTNEKNVFEYLSRFTGWLYQYHFIKSSVDGKLLPFPINLDTINDLYGMKLTSPAEVQAYYDSVRQNISNPANSEEMIISKIGKDLYNKFYKAYTFKQWGIDAKDLSGSVTARIPVRTNRDARYFNDIYQAIPSDGYTSMFNKMISHKNISILLNTDYKEIIDTIKFNKIIYTGPVDEYFDFMYGHLPYRSLKFEHETFDCEFYQCAQQINYPNDYDFTRIIEWKHATKQIHRKTTITREYPIPATEGLDKYYPIPTIENQILYEKYENEIKKLSNVIFCGRLAEYKYYNMDQIVARALMTYNTKIV